MEGTPLSTSAVKRIAVAKHLAAAELRQVDAGGNADGNAHQAGKCQNDSRADDGVRHAATLLDRPARECG